MQAAQVAVSGLLDHGGTALGLQQGQRPMGT